MPGEIQLTSTESSLSLAHLRLHLEAEEDLRLPAFNKGNAIRGGFGSTFRRLVCVDLRWECAECLLRFSCAYTAVFNPFVPPDADRLRRSQNIPRPFAVKPPLSTQTTYTRGTELVFDLVVVGRAVDHLPYFVLSFRELGHEGFGLNRAPVRLAQVEAVSGDGGTRLVYDADSNIVRPPPRIDVPVGGGGTGETDEAESAVTVEFLTPTTLTYGSQPGRSAELVRRPEFHHLAKRLRDRVNALATFYGAGPLDLDFKQFGIEAEGIRTVDDETTWIERGRLSRRREVVHDLSGFAGRVTFRGRLARFLPLLRLGEYVHVGKNAVFGNGWFRAHPSSPEGVPNRTPARTLLNTRT